MYSTHTCLCVFARARGGALKAGPRRFIPPNLARLGHTCVPIPLSPLDRRRSSYRLLQFSSLGMARFALIGPEEAGGDPTHVSGVFLSQSSPLFPVLYLSSQLHLQTPCSKSISPGQTRSRGEINLLQESAQSLGGSIEEGWSEIYARESNKKCACLCRKSTLAIAIVFKLLPLLAQHFV